MAESALPFGTLDSYQGNFKSSIRRRYLGMMATYKKFNRALIPETGSVFFLKAYLPTLIALDIKEKFPKLKEKDISERIEAFCCWYSLKEQGARENSKRVKGKKKLKKLIDDGRNLPKAPELQKEYTETTFRQSCVRSLQKLGLRDGLETSLSGSLLTEDGEKFLVGFFSNRKKELEQVEQLLVAWLKEGSFKELLQKDLSVLNFYEDTPKGLTRKLNEHIKSGVAEWFDSLPHDNFDEVLGWLNDFKQFVVKAPEGLKEKTKYINSFFKFHRSCVLLSDLMENELAENQEFVISDWAKKNKELIEFCRGCAKDFLQKDIEWKKSENAEEVERDICVLAHDIKRARNDEEVLFLILMSNEKKGLTFALHKGGTVRQKGESKNSTKSFDIPKRMQWIQKAVCIPQVWKFAELQWPLFEAKFAEINKDKEEYEPDDE